MRRSIFWLLLFISSFTLLSAQGIQLVLIPDRIESFIDNTDFIANDQINISNRLPGSENPEESATPYNIEPESVLSPKNSFIRIPLKYSWKQLRTEFSIPYYFKREIEYQEGAKSTSGLGDIVMKAAYFLRKNNIDNETEFSIKFPNGDNSNTVDGYLVPLGTGSTDFVIKNLFLYEVPRYYISSSVNYRLTGETELVAEIVGEDSTERVEYLIDSGDNLTFNINFGYKHVGIRNLSLVAGYSLMINQGGTFDRIHRDNPDLSESGLEAAQEFTFMDIIPGISYRINRFDLLLAMKIPIVTERNEFNNEADRSASVLFKLSGRVF